MNTAKKAHLTFIQLAKEKGYLCRVVGDYMFTQSNNPHSPYIKLIGAKHNVIQISENGNHYETPIKEIK